MEIKKRTGEKEQYSIKKSHDSMIKAGANEKTATSISDGIKTHPGITTTEVRKEILKGLEKQEPGSAKHFDEYRKPSFSGR